MPVQDRFASRVMPDAFFPPRSWWRWCSKMASYEQKNEIISLFNITLWWILKSWDVMRTTRLKFCGWLLLEPRDANALKYSAKLIAPPWERSDGWGRAGPSTRARRTNTSVRWKACAGCMADRTSDSLSKGLCEEGYSGWQKDVWWRNAHCLPVRLALKR